MRLVTEKHHLLFFIYSAISCRDSVTTTYLIMVTKLLSSVLLMFHFELKYIFESAKCKQSKSNLQHNIGRHHGCVYGLKNIGRAASDIQMIVDLIH